MAFGGGVTLFSTPYTQSYPQILWVCIFSLINSNRCLACLAEAGPTR